MRYLIILTFPFMLCVLANLHASVRGSFGCGCCFDHEEYSIASPKIDPLSKLEWSGVQSFERLGELEWVDDQDQLYLGIEGAFGDIFGGTFIDYDWAESGERSLWSETTSHVQGNTYDFVLKVGREFFFEKQCFVLFRPIVGISYHSMHSKHLDMYDGLRNYRYCIATI